MSVQQSSTSPSTVNFKVRYAIAVWLAALIIFLLWLIITVAGGPPSPTLTGTGKNAQSEPQVGSNAYIVKNLPPWGSVPTPSLPFEPSSEYVLSGYGLQGFYQSVPPNPAWTVSLPEPTVTAQLVKRGDSPAIVTENVRLSWEMEIQTGNSHEGQANTDYEYRGDMAAAADGLSFAATVPASAMQTDGSINPYPIVRITAREDGSGRILAQSAAVVAVGPGFGCAHCHADAGFSILKSHDKHQGTDLEGMAKSGAPVDCRSCHDGLSRDGDTLNPGAGLSFSAAIHGWHAPYLAGGNSEACMTCHEALGDSGKDERPRPLFLRDVHMDRGLGCINCHGTLEDHALALLKAEQQAGQENAAKGIAAITPRSVKDIGEITPRLPWVQQPDCAGCHNFNTKPGSHTASAFNAWTKNADERFNRATDYTATLRCPSCHGAPHAVYPASNPIGSDRDIMVPLQYQQHARALGAAGNCALCHMQSMDMSAHHPLVERKTTQVHVPEDARITLPRVNFPHASHARLACTACHHTGREDGKSLVCASAGCHDKAEALAQDGSSNIMYFRKAFHGENRSCFYCHTALRQEGKGSGPVACKDCHRAPSPIWEREQTTAHGAATSTPSPTTMTEPSPEGASTPGVQE